jgi:hypothetical protein
MRCRVVTRRVFAAAPSTPGEASWTWLDCSGRLVNYDPVIRDAYIEWHESAVDTAVAFGYQGA